MKKILILPLFLILISCIEPPNPNAELKKFLASLKVVEIHGCEYLVQVDDQQQIYIATHKGDCKNPIHYNLKIVKVERTKETIKEEKE